jgi:hypothetical protein
MPMGDCERFKKYYSNYIEKRLDPAVIDEINQHLDYCDECKKVIRQIRILQKMMADLPLQKCSENFNLKLHQRIFSRSTQKERNGIIRKYSYAVSFIIAVVFIIFFVYSLFNKKEQPINNQLLPSYSETPVPSAAAPAVDPVDFRQNDEGINIKTKSGDNLVSDSSNHKKSDTKSPNIKYVGQEK